MEFDDRGHSSAVKVTPLGQKWCWRVNGGLDFNRKERGPRARSPDGLADGKGLIGCGRWMWQLEALPRAANMVIS